MARTAELSLTRLELLVVEQELNEWLATSDERRSRVQECALERVHGKLKRALETVDPLRGTKERAKPCDAGDVAAESPR